MYQQQQQQQQQQPSENLTVEQYQYDQAQRTNQLKQIVQYQAEQYGELRQHVDYNFQTMDKNLQGRIHTVHQLTENTGMELKTMITDQEEIIKEVRVAVYITAGFAGALLLLAIVLLVLWWRRNPLRSMVEEMNQVVANLKVAMSSNANLPPRARTVSLPATAGQPLSIA